MYFKQDVKQQDALGAEYMMLKVSIAQNISPNLLQNIS